jgi:hypothetical protein
MVGKFNDIVSSGSSSNTKMKQVMKQVGLDLQSVSDKILTHNTDLLEISAHIYNKFRDGCGERWVDFKSINVSDISEDDKHLAKSIKNHFEKQLFLWSIATGKLSNFQSSLKTFLEMDYPRSCVPLSFYGMIYSLPDMYQRDLKTENVMEKLRSLELNEKCFSKGPLRKTTIELEYIGSVPPKNLGNPAALYEYWFYHGDMKCPFLLTMKSKNSTRQLWEKYISENKVNVTGDFTPWSYIPGGPHFLKCFKETAAGNWEIVNLS